MVDFVKKNWQFRDIISENELNRIEDGIEEGITKAEQADQKAQQAQQTANQTASDLAAHLAETVSKVVMVTEPFDQTTKTTVNLGFKPKMVTIDAIIFNTIYESHGSSDGINQHVRFRIVSDNVLTYDSTVIVEFFHTSSAYIVGACTFTNDGIEITWTKVGTLPEVSGNRHLIISAITHGEG